MQKTLTPIVINNPSSTLKKRMDAVRKYKQERLEQLRNMPKCTFQVQA